MTNIKILIGSFINNSKAHGNPLAQRHVKHVFLICSSVAPTVYFRDIAHREPTHCFLPREKGLELMSAIQATLLFDRQ